MTQANSRKAIAACEALGVIGYGQLVYMFRKMIKEGIYADENHTSGAFTVSDVVGSLLAVILIVVGLITFYRAFVKVSTAHKQENSSLTNIKVCSFWSLIFSCLTFVTYWFGGLAVLLGIGVVLSTIRPSKAKQPSLWVYMAAGIFAVLGTVLHLLIIFNTK